METEGFGSHRSSDGDGYVPLRHGEKTYWFRVAAVNLTTLRASMGWQRRLRRAMVEKIKRDFHPFGVWIAVAHLPDGRVFCIGGQHCATAALELGYKDWAWAFHVKVEDEMEAARLYRALLNTHRPTPQTQTEVDLEAHIPHKLAHLAVLEKAGRTWARTRSKANWNAFTTFGATEWVEERVGEEGLIHQLQFANKAWPDQPEVCNGDVVRAIFYLFRDWRTVHGKFKEEELANALRGTDLPTFIDLARVAEFRRSFGDQALGQALARVLAEHFNKKTSGYKLYHLSALRETKPE